MADKYINAVGLTAIKQWIEGKFALNSDLTTLSGRVDDIEAVGGEPNVIDTVKVNGTALVPDASKAVNVIVPTSTSDLTNDGDGDSPFATQEYVGENGGKIDVIQVNGTAQTITNKTVNITMPTKVSDLTNDSGFQTSANVATAISDALANSGDPYQTQTEVQALIDSELADITSIDFQVVDTLPATGVKGTIYLVPNSGTSPNTYDEYIWIEPTGGTAHFEKIGTTDVDLSGYWTSESGKANSLIAMTTAEVNAILNA